MARVFIGVGSNIDRERNIRAGIEVLRARFGDLQISPVYETSAVGFEGENFFNLVVGFKTELTPVALLEVLHGIEAEFGRKRNEPRFAPRVLDLDLLLYDDYVSQADNLHIPREDITKYAFVLKPLAEIAGELRHPVSGERYRDLWERFDCSGQELWQVEFDL